ncbi:MAG: glycosyltransferase family 4 protein [bacterium]|nr:glycosyltransferase family 4 protein [bacterium]
MHAKTKTAAIYNRWLFTLGGGEQVAFAYAEALRDAGYETKLLTHKRIDRQKAEEKMNVDLSEITIEYLPLTTSNELSAQSEEYDLFINTSYLDYFPNRSKNGYLSVFFPAEIYLSPWEFLKRSIFIPTLKLLFVYPTEFDGFSHDSFSNGKILKWLGHHSSITFNSTQIHKLSIELYFPTFAYSLSEGIVFLVNESTHLKPKTKTLNHKTNVVRYTFESVVPITSLTIDTSTLTSKNIAITQIEIPKIRYLLYNQFKRFFPKWEMRLHGGPGVTSLSDIQSYKKIITISKFCQYWIGKYWGLPSVVLYPPVNIKAFSASKKVNWITHIGRFFVTGHSKKQLELIQVFKELVDSNELVGWELHLIGSVYEGENHQEYFTACVEEAKGYPVVFHTQAPFSEVKEILSKSKIYWHATGLDEDPTKQPILMEHFGITTVEAMASGCIPVVINAGGQPEIVTPGSGYVWNTRAELKKRTQEIAQSTSLQKQLSVAARERSKYFSREEFKKRFEKIIK